MDSMHFLLHETFGKPCLLSLVLCHHLCIRDSTKPLAGICIVSTTCSYMCPRKTKLLYSTRSGQKLHRIPLINRSQQATVVHSKGLHSVGLHSVGLHGESTWIHSGITFTGTLTWALEYNFWIQPDSGCLSDVHYFELSVPMKISSPQQACGISKSCKNGWPTGKTSWINTNTTLVISLFDWYFQFAVTYLMKETKLGLLFFKM